MYRLEDIRRLLDEMFSDKLLGWLIFGGGCLENLLNLGLNVLEG